MIKKVLLSFLMFCSSLSSFALHITQEDIDGTGPHFIIDDIWACIVFGVVGLIIVGIILWCIFGTIWIGLERLLGIKRTTMYFTSKDVYLAHSSKHLRRFKTLSKRLNANCISDKEKLEYEELLRGNYVFKAHIDDKIHVLCYYFNGICQVNQGGWVAELYTFYSWLSPRPLAPFDYEMN